MRSVMTLVVLLAVPAAGWAQGTSGTLIPTDGGAALEIASQEVDVRINNGMAVTTITQVFRNNEPQQREAVYSFPVPAEASVSNFSMWIGGKEVIGEVLEKKKAREIYQSITSQKRDPGLLEQVSYKLFEVRVFPVPARGEQRIQIAYYQPLELDGGFATYVYPLESRTKEFSTVAGTLKIEVEVLSQSPLKRVWSPSHKDAVAVAETKPARWRASLEQPKGRIDNDFVLTYELDREKTGLTLVPYAKRGEDGYFMLMLTAGADLDRSSVPVNYVFVLDVSGSMADQRKLEMATKAARQMIAGLAATDTFNMIAFNIAPKALSEAALPASEESSRVAFAFMNQLQPSGGTEIVPALERAGEMMSTERDNILIILSDGNATDGDDHRRFRTLLEKHRTKVRIFSFGVGNEVNRPLLGTLAERTGGYADFVSSGDEVERKTKLFQQKMRHHVAEDVTIAFDGVRVYDVTPAKFPSLFRGSQAVVYGRYKGGGTAKVTLAGRIGVERKTLVDEIEFPHDEPDNPEVRRMWAWKRTDEFMRDIRMNGETPALIKQVTDIGCAHSIVTPYTSFLVLENDQQYRQFGIEQRNAQQIQTERDAQQRRSTSGGGTARSGRGGGGGSIEIGMIALVAAIAAARAVRR